MSCNDKSHESRIQTTQLTYLCVCDGFMMVEIANHNIAMECLNSWYKIAATHESIACKISSANSQPGLSSLIYKYFIMLRYTPLQLEWFIERLYSECLIEILCLRLTQQVRFV